MYIVVVVSKIHPCSKEKADAIIISIIKIQFVLRTKVFA